MDRTVCEVGYNYGGGEGLICLKAVCLEEVVEIGRNVRERGNAGRFINVHPLGNHVKFMGKRIIGCNLWGLPKRGDGNIS